jgi:adenine-specific DNA-methyltransferase
MPEFIEGPVGRVFHGDASGTANAAGPVTLAYLDPPYNQHSYLGNYHVWETLARGDAPEAYGVARKRQDVRERKSAWNSKRAAHAALRELVGEIDARWILCSFNVEGHIGIDEITETLAARTGEQVAGAALPHPRYVGARIGIHDHRGERVGTPGALETTEWLLLAGPNAYELMQRALPEDVVVADPARPRPELAPR